MNNYKIQPVNISFLLLIIIPLSWSCNKLVNVDPPVNEVVSATVFTDEHAAIAAMDGLYSQMTASSNIFANGAVTVYTALSSDELFNSSNSTILSQFTQNALTPDNSTLRNTFWQRAYSHIYHANAIIEGVGQSASLSDSLKKSLKGEAVVVRSFCYFYLVNLFGDVPLILTTDYSTNAILPRSKTTDIYNQLTEDLESVIPQLPDFGYGNRIRPDKWAATALLARLYLYTGNWQKAEQKSSEVIQSGNFILEPDLNNVFLSGSREAIWQLMPVATGFNTYEGFNFIPYSASAIPSYPATSFLLNSFENGDNRKNAWLKQVQIGTQNYAYPYKYKLRNSSPVKEYYVMLRLAEQYLIRSEARANLNNLSGACDDLNLIRQRAGLSPLSISDKNILLQAILHERQTELFTEWGHRWFDLKRTENADSVLSPIKPDWQPTDTLYPIPQQEILLNVYLTQNPGY